MKTENLWNRAHGSTMAMPRGGSVEKVIAHLPVPLRWIMILGESNGFSTGEIANLAGVSPEAVKSIRRRGRSFIKEELLRPVRRGLVMERQP